MPKPLVRHTVTETGGKRVALALATTAVTLLTGGTSLKDADAQASGYGGNVVAARIRNSNTTTKRRVRLYNIPTTLAADESTIFFDEEIAPKGFVYFQPPAPERYKDSAVIKGDQDAGTDVLVLIEAEEFY
jgi:hypothetical protein